MKHARMRQVPALCLSLAILGALPLSAQTVIRLDHASTPNESTTPPYDLANNEEFTVEIINTDTVKFDCEVTGVEIVPAPNSPIAVARRASTTTDTKTIKHDEKFGLYIVRATIKPDESHTTLESRIWYIAVAATGWHMEVGMGLVGSALADPKYFLDESDDGTKLVAHDRDAEDVLDFGFASLATIYHDKFWNWGKFSAGASLGLAINDNDISVLIGPTLRMGQRSSLTLGYNWRNIDDLPAGLALGDSFTGDALTLESRTDGDWFFAITIRGFTDQQGRSTEVATKTQ